MDFSDLDVNDTTHPRNKYGLPDPSVCFMSNAFLNRTTKTTFYIGIKAMGANGTNATTVTVAPAADATGGSTDTAVDTYTPVGYALQTYASSCSFWDEENEVWSYDGCEVGELTTPYSTQCLCNHLTAFGGGMVVPMNTINFADSAFNKLDENPAVFSTMVAITCLYFILCIWARKADKIDEMKAGTTPLPDNDPRHKYLYEILVYTGSRKGGGTTAQVSMVFTGDEDETEPRLFWDPKRPVFERGGVDSFLMACPRPLGSLSLARVWHDNSGKSPGWAFSRIQVTDIQTGAKYFFICDRWLAVEEDDGLIDRVVPLAGKEELTQFNHLFWSQTKKNLYDGHIWFSIFTRPRRSHFTRVQRLTCVLSLLFCTMLSNIMFYKADSQSTPQVYKLGPLQFTLEGIITGVIASLIVFPINLLIVQLFRLSRPKPKKPITSTYGNDTKTGDETLSDELEKQKQFLETGDHSKRLLMTPTPKSSVGVSYIGSDKGTPAVKNATKEEDKSKKKKKKKGIRFPWWSIYIAYSVSFCSVVLSVYFCTEFAGAMGATKAEQWLGSFMISCMESVFLTQPIKIFGLAVFYALVIKSPDVDEEGDEDRDNNLKPDEEYLHEDQVTGVAKPMKPSLAPEPPDEEYIRAAREKRFKEIKTQAVIREILIYFVFTYLLFMVGYGNRDPWSFHFYENVENMISKGSFLDTDSPPQFDSILKSEDFWSWAEQTLVPAIYGIPFYDGQDYTWQNGFLADQQTYRVGAPRLRLLKTKPKMCMPPIYKYVRECRPDYSMFGEDEESYGIGWQVINTSDPNSQPDAHWTYRTSSETDGYPIIGRISTYGGGGYVAELGTDSATALSVIQELKDNLWIDRYTRGVIVEFVMWNPNINLFAISYSVVEFPQSGGAWPSYKVNVMRLDRYVGTYMFMVLGAEILVAAFIIFFLVKMIRDIRREGFKIYIKEFWNAVEFFILIVSIGAIVMYFYRLLISKMVSSEFSEDPHKFVNFQYAAYWDECYTILMGIMVFVYTVKFLKLMRFNRRMSVIGRTLKEAGKPMFVYLMAFFIIFLAYGQFAYILFGRVLLNYSTFITTLETLFSMMLNKFDFYEIDAVSPFFARIMFITFMVLVSFIVVNLFLTLIMDAFAYVSYMTSKEKNELEVVEYMVNAVKGMFGISTGKKPEPYVPSKFQYQDGGEGTVEDLDQKIESMIGKLENYLDIQATDKRVMKEMEAMKPAKRKILMA
ncbi:polycystic kidney disease protein 1-like 2 [Lingula anatina]|uniref:Polycystic kidney disease protein 1-like 2 n=1 Tax=Lingula anatina TaxID=7574 RepID=A0A1S3HIV6_LINAN|nr:polycystic kidney disease protein 1-like 2 [Lingula anatina]|eukprot:XP_013386043.1 polycystic kidney disease protein 1-like 2 [Lingula anatina]